MKREWISHHEKEKCSVCGKEIEPGEDMLVVRFTNEFEVVCKKHGEQLEEMYDKKNTEEEIIE